MTTPKSKGPGRKPGRFSSQKASQSTQDAVAALTKPIAVANQQNIAAFDKQAAEYKVLYEASLAFLQAVEASGAENLGQDVRRTSQSLNRVLDGNTP